MKLILSFILLFVFSSFAYSQSTPTYRDRGGKVVSMSNMLGSADGMKCRARNTILGNIVKRNYLEDETTISSFILKGANDRRTSINIDSEQLSVWGRETNKMISEVLALNSKVKVAISECSGGGSGIFKFARQIVKY